MGIATASLDRPFRYLSSPIGRKQLMAVTGLVWSGFVLSHMLGNLLILIGPDAYNSYGHAIVNSPILYMAEATLVFTLVLHIINGVCLTRENRLARQTRYAMPTNGQKAARFQSKFMIFHGSLLLVFLVLHLLAFKYGNYYETTVNGVVMRDLHRLVVEKFHDITYVLWYSLSMVVVGLHLSHGFYSAFASLGVFHPKYSPCINVIGYVYGVVVAAGFLAQPLYVYFILR